MKVSPAARALAADLLAAPAPAGEAGWAMQARAEAAARLTAMGAPARRDEYWRYTDPAALLRAPAPGSAPAADPFAALDAVALRVGEAAPEGEGFLAERLDDALAGEGFARALFGRLEAAGQEKVARPLAALNTARAPQGFAVRVTGAPARPLKLVNGPAMARSVIRVEPGACATVIETGRVANGCVEIELCAGATLHHVRAQMQGAASATHLFARLAAGAALRSFTLTADGALSRNEVVVDLAGEGAAAQLGGAVLARGGAHADNTVFVTHGGLNGRSRQVYKHVVEGAARAVFQGKIFVRPGAQKTDGYQISQAILLSEGATFSARPELEIYADDVICSHGSTTGALDAIALFYLRARGVPLRRAQAMMVGAFVEEAVGEIADPALADVIRAQVDGWMALR